MRKIYEKDKEDLSGEPWRLRRKAEKRLPALKSAMVRH